MVTESVVVVVVVVVVERLLLVILWIRKIQTRLIALKYLCSLEKVLELDMGKEKKRKERVRTTQDQV